MKALVYLGPRRIAWQDMPKPEPRPGEVLVRVEACGICGSDMHGYHGQDPRRHPPLVLGHEASGWIESGSRTGSRVAVNPIVTCMQCRACLGGQPHLCPERQTISLPPRDGAFAEFVCIPEGNLVPIPDSMDFATAALAEPIAVSWHAVQLGARLLQRPLASARVLVLGGGAIGLAAALVLRLRGAGEILLAEPHEFRRRLAAEAGVPAAYGPGEDRDVQTGSIDLVIDAVGAAATRATASRAVSSGGAIVHLGLLPGSEGLDVRRITLEEIVFSGSYCYTQADFRETVDALAAGRLGDLGWVGQRPMEEGPAAFAELDQGTARATKVVLRN